MIASHLYVAESIIDKKKKSEKWQCMILNAFGYMTLDDDGMKTMCGLCVVVMCAVYIRAYSIIGKPVSNWNRVQKVKKNCQFHNKRLPG